MPSSRGSEAPEGAERRGVFNRGSYMGFKAGGEHHSVIALKEAKVKVIDFARQGLSIQDSIIRAGRTLIRRSTG
jgi:hypothetical protein